MRRHLAAIRSDLLAIADWSGRSRGARASPEIVDRTARRRSQFLDDVVIDHRRLDIRVPEVLLNLPDIDAVEQQVRREQVTQGVYGHGLVDLRLARRRIDGFLNHRVLMWWRRTTPARGSVESV